MSATVTEMVAVLTTDLVGSTAMADRFGPEAVEGLRTEHFGLLRGVLERTAGREVKNLGDGLMVVFDSAAQSLVCAVQMQQALEGAKSPRRGEARGANRRERWSPVLLRGEVAEGRVSTAPMVASAVTSGAGAAETPRRPRQRLAVRFLIDGVAAVCMLRPPNERKDRQMNPRSLAPTRVARMMGVGSILAVFVVGVLLPEGALASRQAPLMMMSAGSPEHVADALGALTAGKTSLAKKDLSTAIANSAEPKMARMHAREALTSLTQHKTAAARMHAQNGTAVEHFTYALRALNQGKVGADTTARMHLNEALALPPYKKYAKAALAALTGHDRKTAKAKTVQGLSAAEMAP